MNSEYLIYNGDLYKKIASEIPNITHSIDIPNASNLKNVVNCYDFDKFIHESTDEELLKFVRKG